MRWQVKSCGSDLLGLVELAGRKGGDAGRHRGSNSYFHFVDYQNAGDCRRFPARNGRTGVYLVLKSKSSCGGKDAASLILNEPSSLREFSAERGKVSVAENFPRVSSRLTRARRWQALCRLPPNDRFAPSKWYGTVANLTTSNPVSQPPWNRSPGHADGRRKRENFSIQLGAFSFSISRVLGCGVALTIEILSRVRLLFKINVAS